jgi:transforming growth factor-beta-induced protein
MLTDAVADDNAQLTVLAPVNSAFAKIPKDELEALLADKDALTGVSSAGCSPGCSSTW